VDSSADSFDRIVIIPFLRACATRIAASGNGAVWSAVAAVYDRRLLNQEIPAVIDRRYSKLHHYPASEHWFIWPSGQRLMGGSERQLLGPFVQGHRDSGPSGD